MRTRKKAYLTKAARDYVLSAKKRLKQILRERGITHSALEDMTGIPASTISHWLNVERSEFLSLADAVVVCDALGIAIIDILPAATWRHRSAARYADLSFFLEMPIAHAKWLIIVYKGAIKLFGKQQ